MHQDAQPPEDDGGGGGPPPTPDKPGERLYAGKYKTVEDMEKALESESKLAGRARRAFPALEAAGIMVDEAGTPYQVRADDTTAEREPPVAEAADDDGEDLAAKVKRLEAAIGNQQQVAPQVMRAIVQSERGKAEMLQYVPPDQREAAEAKWDEAIASFAPGQINDRSLSTVRRVIIGELAEAKKTWWEGTPPKPAAAAADMLDENGGVEPAGSERRGPGRPPGNAVEREVAARMIEAGDLKGPDGKTPQTVDEYLQKRVTMRREAAKSAGEE